MGLSWNDQPGSGSYPRGFVGAIRLEASRMRHKELVDRVGQLALEVGRRKGGEDTIRISYSPDSRHIRTRKPFARGFPDLVVVGPGGLILAELKCADDTLSPDQRAWAARLTAAGQFHVIWEPLDLFSGRVETELASICEPHPSRRRPDGTVYYGE